MEYYEAATKVALKAGEMIKASFNDSSKATNEKEGPNDLVTETDRKVEQFVFNELRLLFPQHKFIGEESSAGGVGCSWTDEETWIVDPIDGTTNFIHRIPDVCISMALAINKQIVVGVVYNPIRGEMYRAMKGDGAFLNDEKIFVSSCDELGRAVVFSNIGSDVSHIDDMTANIRSVASSCRSMRFTGSACINMCYVARGIANAYYEFGPHIWDFAAGLLIVEEAGGFSCLPNGDDVDLTKRAILCAANASLAKQLVEKLSHPFFKTPDCT